MADHQLTSDSVEDVGTLLSRYVEWMLLSFPLWVLLVSLYILWDNLHVHPTA